MRSPDGDPRPVPDLPGAPAGGTTRASGEAPGDGEAAGCSDPAPGVDAAPGADAVSGSGVGRAVSPAADGPAADDPAAAASDPGGSGPGASGPGVESAGSAGETPSTTGRPDEAPVLTPYGPPAVPPQFGAAPYGPAPYGQAPYGQAPYGQAPYGQAPYGQAPYGQAPYGRPGHPGAWPPGPDGMPRVGPGVIGPPPVRTVGEPGHPAPGPRRPHRWGFPAYLLVEGVFLGVSALLGWLLVRGSAPGVWTVAVLLGLPTLCAATVAIVATIVRGNGPRIDLGLRFSWRDVGLGVAFGVGGLVLSVPAALIYIAIVGPENANSAVGDVFENLTATPAQAFLVFALVALVAPFCEEIVYRGLLWGAMEKHGANRWVAFALTTIIFALAHFEFTRTPLLLVVAIPIGLARALTGNLTSSVVAHQINNLLPALALALSLTGALPGAA